MTTEHEVLTALRMAWRQPTSDATAVAVHDAIPALEALIAERNALLGEKQRLRECLAALFDEEHVCDADYDRAVETLKETTP